MDKNEIYKAISSAQKGDKKAFEQLYNANIGLIWNAAKRFYGRGIEPDDLFQLGSIGLIRAIERFDITLGLAFSTYAVPMIFGEIRRFLRDDGLIKVSRSLKDLNAKVYSTREKLTARLGREPLLHEIAEDLAVAVEEIAEAMEATATCDSLSAERGENSEITLIESLCDDENIEENVTLKIALQNALSTCESRERSLILMRYFEGKTQCEIGAALGISQVQVSRLETRILKRLKAQLA